MEFPFMHKSGLEPLKALGEAENFRLFCFMAHWIMVRSNFLVNLKFPIFHIVDNELDDHLELLLAQAKTQKTPHIAFMFSNLLK